LSREIETPTGAPSPTELAAVLSEPAADALGVLSRVLTCATEWGIIDAAPRFAKLKAQ